MTRTRKEIRDKAMAREISAGDEPTDIAKRHNVSPSTVYRLMANTMRVRRTSTRGMNYDILAELSTGNRQYTEIAKRCGTTRQNVKQVCQRCEEAGVFKSMAEMERRAESESDAFVIAFRILAGYSRTETIAEVGCSQERYNWVLSEIESTGITELLYDDDKRSINVATPASFTILRLLLDGHAVKDVAATTQVRDENIRQVITRARKAGFEIKLGEQDE